MARGNWRNWEGRNGAEAHGRRREIDGWVMKVSGTYDNESDATNVSEFLKKEGYHSAVTKGTKYWTVWRTLRKGQTRCQRS